MGTTTLTSKAVARNKEDNVRQVSGIGLGMGAFPLLEDRVPKLSLGTSQKGAAFLRPLPSFSCGNRGQQSEKGWEQAVSPS